VFADVGATVGAQPWWLKEVRFVANLGIKMKEKRQ